MLLGARLGMSGVGGSPRPYDAEVEYLESTGTQYINTGIKPTRKQTDKCVFTPTTTYSSYQIAFYGAGKSGGQPSLRFIPYQGKVTFWNGANFVSSGVSATSGTEFTVYRTPTELSVNTTTVPYSIHTGAYSDGNTYLFCYNNRTTNSADGFSNIAIKSYEVWDSGLKIIDLIPVRKGSVGYMYDRISGELFGNAGSGSFIIGPDK